MRLMRLATTLTALLMMAAAPMSALGHSGLAESTPADGSTLARAPSEVRLAFSGELVPDGTGFTVVDGAIVIGHVAGIVLAHRLARQDQPERAGLVGLPMVALMVGYTVLSLWIIAAPIVIEPGTPPSALLR